MKNSPKNFYNVVDKKKLGIDEAIAVAGEVEQLQSDVSGIETTLGNADSGLIKQVNDLQTTVDNIDYDISRKADIDGTYPDLTAGHAQNAEQLDSTVMVEDSEPYIFRTSGGSKDIGNRENDQLVGGSIGWNQLVDTSTSSVTIPSGLKVLTFINGSWDIIESDGNAIAVTGGTDMVFDLTRMFGIIFANALYTMEQNNAGDGVNYFRKLFPKAHYAYNAGETLSVKVIAHEMVGFNAYDHATGKAKLLGGHEYQITGTYTAIAYEDINGNSETITPDASGIFTPTNDGIMTVTGGTDTDTCIHLTWSGYRNGEFEPYTKYSYVLDQDLELRGIANVSNGVMYFDGDTYSHDGTVIRKYGVIDIGSLDWTYTESNGLFSKTIPGKKNGVANIICGLYSADNKAAADMSNMTMKGANSAVVYIKNTSYTDLASFKAAMSGVYLVYELATPTTESADPFQDPQYVEDFGTEEYVDIRSVPVPVGHNTSYPANLRDKLQHLPEPTGVNGTYLIKEENEKMTLVPDQIPALPTTDGTYVLSCTVSDGVATVAWIANT